MKKKIIFIGVVLTAVLAAGITVAFMFRKTEPVLNNFEPGEVSCEIAEVFDGTEKSSIRVKNTGNIDAYLRVRIVSYWVNEAGDIVGKPSEMPEILYNSLDWLKSPYSDTYYYKYPVAPGGVTGTDLLQEDQPIVLSESEFNGETVYQAADVFAEAIQTQPENAAEEAWNADVENNEIINVN